jgi:hypothetical protein
VLRNIDENKIEKYIPKYYPTPSMLNWRKKEEKRDGRESEEGSLTMFSGRT